MKQKKNRYILLAALLATGLGVLGIFTPNNLDDRDQALQGLYVLDVFYNGKVILQTEHQDEPASKPPLYNWLSALVSIPFGEVNEFTLRLPSILAGIGLAIITFLFAYELFGELVAIIACLILMINFHFIKLITTARTDMLLTFFITLAFYFFYKAYTGKKAKFYVLFWLSLALATLTKGIVGVALPLLTVLVYLVIVKDLALLKRAWLPNLGGFLIWLIIAGGWFALALKEGGQVFWDKQIINEVWERFWGVGARAEHTRPFYYTAGYIIGRFLPWVLFLPAAICAVFPVTKESPRQKLILPFAWFITFFVVFTTSAGKRVDYVFPLYPAMAILIAGLWQGMSPKSVKLFSKTLYVATLGIFAFLKPNKSVRAVAILLVAALFGNIYYGFWGSKEAKTCEAKHTKEFCQEAKEIIGGNEFRIYKAPNSAYFYMKSNSPILKLNYIQELLNKGVYVIMPKSEVKNITADIILESRWIGEGKEAYLLLKSPR